LGGLAGEGDGFSEGCTGGEEVFDTVELLSNVGVVVGGSVLSVFDLSLEREQQQPSL